MGLYKFIDNLIPFTKRGIRNAYIIILTPYFSTPFIMYLLQLSPTWNMILLFGSMIVFAFPFGVLAQKQKDFKNQQEDYRRKDFNHRTVFYRYSGYSKWFTFYLGKEDERKYWNNLKSDPFFIQNGEWEMGGPTDDWEKRQHREKRLGKLLNKK